MNKMSTPQSVSLLCSDDIVRDPKTSRKVRITRSVETGNVWAAFHATDIESGEAVTVMFRKTSRVSVWTD